MSQNALGKSDKKEPRKKQQIPTRWVDKASESESQINKPQSTKESNKSGNPRVEPVTVNYVNVPPSTPANPNMLSSGEPGTGRNDEFKGASNAPPLDTPSMAQFKSLIPPDALKTIRLQRPRKNSTTNKPIGSTPDRPIAPKIIILKKAPPDAHPPSDESLPLSSSSGSDPYPYILHDKSMLPDAPPDKQIDKKLTEMLNEHREYVSRKLKRRKKQSGPTYRFPEMVQTLTEQGIPCPINEDFARLQSQHSRWDPQGTIIEYFSPVLRTFVPINMRGRYRGCSTDDNCMRGLDISKVPPKRDALEGFVDRGRHNNIQQRFDEMSTVALDEAHLDYLIEIQAYHAETLPIPIFYDMLHLGMEVANEHLRILVQEDGYPPNNMIFTSAQSHAEQLRRKIQMYGALGLEILESERKGLGHYKPQWLKSRDEIIQDILRAKDEMRSSQTEKKEEQADLQEKPQNGEEEKDSDLNKKEEIAASTRASAKSRILHALLGKGKKNKISPADQNQGKGDINEVATTTAAGTGDPTNVTATTDDAN